MSRPRFNPCLQGPRSLVSGFEKRENNKRAHGSGSWFHTQDDGHRCNVVQCACRVEQNGIALPCAVDFLPHEVGASTKHHPLCVHASRPSQLVSVHASRLSQLVSHLFQYQGNLPRARQHGSLCPSLVINPRHCVSHDSFTVFIRFFKTSNFFTQSLTKFFTFSRQSLTVPFKFSRQSLAMFFKISRQSLTVLFKISRQSLAMLLCPAIGLRLTPRASSVEFYRFSRQCITMPAPIFQIVLLLFTHQLVLNTFGHDHVGGHMSACSFQQLHFQCGQHVP